jgi:hypothetical protein
MFKPVHVLATSHSISLLAKMIKHLSYTGELIQLYIDAALYKARLVKATLRVT